MKKKTIEINEHTEAHKGHAENKKVAANLLKYLLQIKFQSKTDASKNLIWLLQTKCNEVSANKKVAAN